MIGERVIFDATPGKVKDAATGERWPSTLDMIALESSETKPGGPPADLWQDTDQRTHQADKRRFGAIDDEHAQCPRRLGE